MKLIRDMRGGKEYQGDFAHRMHGQGVWAELIRQRFNQGLKRLGLDKGSYRELDNSLFRKPRQVSAPPSRHGQGDLFA